MLILAAAWLPQSALHAQDADPDPARPPVQRMSDHAVDDEIALEVKVPGSQQAEETPPPDYDAAAQRARLVEENLEKARAALAAGRVDMPPRNSAWFYYRAVLDADPSNPDALNGLVEVQEAMVEEAMDAARELDFESAERILEDASLVRESSEPIDRAHADIRTFREQYARDLEVKAVRAMDAGEFSQAERVLVELIALGGADTLVNQLRRRLEEARIYGGFSPGKVIRDQFINQGIWTPESVVILAGSFLMGSSAFEDGRADNEGPQHRVTFRRGFAIGRTEVTVGDFRAFVSRTGYRTDAEKQGYSMVYNHHSARLAQRDEVTWEMNYEGREADKDEPVVHVSWNDAMAYTRWLARGTGKAYRLPSEAEFEYALRGGSKTRYWWGDDSPDRPVENLTGEHDVSRGRRQWSSYFDGYHDRYWGPAPAASFEPNPFGLHDIAGNIGEWVQDCWHETYIRAPNDGSAWINPGCKLRVIRGGYWASSPDQARSAFRLSARPDRRDARIGFRIARDL